MYNDIYTNEETIMAIKINFFKVTLKDFVSGKLPTYKIADGDCRLTLNNDQYIHRVVMMEGPTGEFFQFRYTTSLDDFFEVIDFVDESGRVIEGDSVPCTVMKPSIKYIPA